MVTHPDSDHVEGIIELFRKFPPNQDQPDRAKFLFKGPLLLTTAFWKRQTPSYNFTSRILKDSSFVGSVQNDGDAIKGFETIFKFYYPDKNVTGVVYDYINPLPSPYPKPGQPPTSFEPNHTSILMMVKDPSDLTKDLISLNGDAYGKDILEVVTKKVKILKVPHHGSKNNSLALDHYKPDEQLDTQKFMATQALLEVIKLYGGVLPAPQPLAYALAGRNVRNFESAYKARFQEAFGVRTEIKKALTFDDTLSQVAQDFKNELEKKGLVADQVLSKLEQRKNQIEANLQDSTVQPKDLYTHATDISPDFKVENYAEIKKAIIQAQKTKDLAEEEAIKKEFPLNAQPPASQLPYRKFEAFEKVFQYLESDSIFLDQVSFRFIAEFYSRIEADTYFISSGSEHNHPHPSVVNGIIEAAKQRYANDNTHKCRLLLTSGNNIKESLLPDGPGYAWKDYVSFQYFLGDTASVVVDPSLAPDVVLAGTKRWDGPGNLSPSLLDDYNDTQGARALKRKRALLLQRPQNYEITSSASNSWLYVTDAGELAFSAVRKVTRVTDIAHEEKDYEDVFKISLETLTIAKAVAVVNGLAGYQVPGDEETSFTLFVYDHGGERKYLSDNAGKLEEGSKQKATSFAFEKAAVLARSRRSLLFSDSSAVSHSSLSDYFRYVGHQEAEIDCRSFLTLASGQPTTVETQKQLEHPLSHFLEQLLNWKLDASSKVQFLDKTVETASLVLHPPSSTSLWNKNVTSVTLHLDNQTVPVQIELKIQVLDEDGMPSTLAYNNVHWVKSIKDGQGTLTVGETLKARSVRVRRSVEANPLSLQDYLNSISFKGDISTLSCKSLLNNLLSSQVVSQLTTTTKVSHNSTTYKFIQLMLEWIVLSSSTFTVSQNQKVTSSVIQLKLPSPLPVLNGNTVHSISLEIDEPLTRNLKIGMKLEQTDSNGFPSTIIHHLEWLVQSFPQQFDDFLKAIEVSPPEGGFDVFDAVILLLQSETSGYNTLNSFPKALISTIRGYKVDKQRTSVSFALTPIGAFLSGDGVNLIADISEANNSFDIGLPHPVTLKKLAVNIPAFDKAAFGTRITAEAAIGNQQLQISAVMMPDYLPSMEFKLTNLPSLGGILSFLQLDSIIGGLSIPIVSQALNDIHITEAGFTISQAVDESNTTTLSSVFFGVEFTNLSSYLPPVFSSLQQANAQAVVYFPSNTSARRVGFKIAFTFVTKEEPPVQFSASLSAQPVLGTSGPESSYNYEVSLSTATSEGTSLSSILSAFGLGDAFSSVKEVPILKSILTNVNLQELTLASNTKSKAIEGFKLHLLIPDWDIIPEKVSLTLFDLYLEYSYQSWEVALESTAVFGGKYPVTVRFKLPALNEAAVLDFKNSNRDFSIAEFLSIFGLGSIADVPIIGKLLQISIVDARLSVLKPTDTSAVSVQEGSVTCYLEALSIASIISLSQVSFFLNFTRNTSTQTFEFGFRVAGFINDKVYLDVGYYPDKSLLSGQALISSFKEADLAFVANSFLSSSASSLQSNNIYKTVSGNLAGQILLALKLGDSTILQHLVIQVVGKIPLAGSLYLGSMKFEYLRDTETPAVAEPGTLFPPGTSVSLMALLSSDENNFHAQLQFNLNKDTTGETTITASIKPDKDHSLKLSSFLSLLGLSTPEIPTVDGQANPNFLDIELNSGSITFATSPFSIKAFDIQVQTAAKITLLSSPRIELESLSLRVIYDTAQSPSLKASLLGTINLAGVKIWLEGVKDEKGLTFSAATAFSPSSDLAQTGNFQNFINQLTPSDSMSPMLPTGVDLPSPVSVGVAQMTINLFTNEKSFKFRGAAQNLNWTISLGFQDFSVHQLGGLIDYTKMLTGEKTSSFTCLVTGQFQYSSALLMDSELHFGSAIDTTLVVLVRDAADIQISSLVNDVLGFNQKKTSTGTTGTTGGETNTNSDVVSFDSLLPESTHSVTYSSAFVNLNLTKSQFLVVGQLASLGSGFLLAGKFGPDKSAGYAFGISLPSGFKFSQLVQNLSVIDNILRVRKANVAVLSLENVKVSDLVSAVKGAQSSFIFQKKDTNVSLPFSNLTLDASTKDKTVGKGMSFYAEIDFGVDQDSVFNSIIQIGDPSSQLPDVVLFAQIAATPKDTRFEAHIEKLALLGLLEFQNVNLVYEPNNLNSLSMTGTITIHLGSSDYTYLGTLHSSNVEAAFSVTSDPTKQPTISEPFGMFGISLQETSLSLSYEFPKDKPHSSQYKVSGRVNFYSSDSLSSSAASDPQPEPTPTISLTGWVLFKNFKPTVASLTIMPTDTLTVSDLVATIFKWHYGTEFLNIGFTKGDMYYASLPQGQPSVEIGGQTYSNGYHISADVEVFSHPFNITADIERDKITVTGSAYAPIDLGFAKFAGIKKSDHSQPDDTRSPELSFTTSNTSTVISINMGLILFDTPFATASVGYDVTNSAFVGQITYSGDIGFIHNPSVSFQWSKDSGFKITSWPMSNPLPFDLLDKLKNYKDKCGDLVDLVFKEAIQTKFSIDTKLSKSEQSEFIAMIDITGTYNILLAGEVKIAAIPLPNLSVGIPKVDNFSLASLPEFILKLFTENADNIVKQLASDPKSLAKVLGVVALKSITKKVVQTLACRDVDTEDLDPEDGGEDVTEDEFEEAEASENAVDDLIAEEIEALAEGGAGLAGGASAATGAVGAAEGGIGIFGGIIAGLASILGIFGISIYSEKQKRAKRRKEELERKKQEAVKKIEDALDIGDAPKPTFSPPNKLSVQWNSITDAEYHITVTGSLVNSTSGQSTETVTIYDKTVSTASVEIQDDRLYRAAGITVTVWGTITATRNGHTSTFNGKKYTAEVENVHPTLHSPSQVTASFDNQALLVTTTTSAVQLAEAYYFQLGEGTTNFQKVAECTFTPKPASQEDIKCTFPHSSIPTESKGPFRVRCQAVANSGSGISSSAYTYSESMQLAPPVSNLIVTPPHFGNEPSNVELAWTLPQSTEDISGLECRVLRKETKAVLITKTLGQEKNVFPISHIFVLSDIVEAINASSPADQTSPSAAQPPSVTLDFQVNTIGKNDSVISSVFSEQTLESLKPPSTVSINFTAETKVLRVSWEFTQETSDYGVTILDDQDSVVWSKLVNIPADDKEQEKTVGYSINESDLSAVANPLIDYTVQVTSVASGNDELDSLTPTEAQQKLRVCSSPIGKTFQFSSTDNKIYGYFSPVADATSFVMRIKGAKGQTLASTSIPATPGAKPEELHASVDIDTFIQSLAGGNTVTATLQSLGGGRFLSSTETGFQNPSLTVLSKPTNLVYNYSPENEMITLQSNAVQNVQNYTLGFCDPNGKVSKIQNTVQSSATTVSTDVSTELLRNSMVTPWKAFARSVGDKAHLSSPLTLLSTPVQVLPKTTIQSFQYVAPNLTVSWDPVLNASAYKAHLRVLSTDDTVLYEKTEDVKMTAQAIITTTFDTSTIPTWPSILKQLHSATVTVAAVGGGYFVTGLPGNPSTISRYPVPETLQYHYSPKDNLITLSVNKVERVSTYVVGFVDPNDNSAPVSKTIKAGETPVISAQFSSKELLTAGEWKVFAQSAGEASHFESTVIYLENNVNVLAKPNIMSATFDPTSYHLAITWNTDANCSQYNIKISVLKKDGSALKLLEKIMKPASAASTSLAVNMDQEIQEWDSLFPQVYSITVGVMAEGSGYFITSPSSDTQSLSRISSPTNLKLDSTGNVLQTTWTAVSAATGYDIIITINGKQVYSDTVSQSVTEHSVDKNLLISKVPSADVYHVKVSVTADSSTSSLPSLPSGVQTDIIKRNVLMSQRIGGSGGLGFDDGILSHSPTIVGIKEIWIRHGNQVDSLQAKYLLADGSTFVAGKHGGNGGTETHLQFADGERITEVRGDSNGVLVDQLTFVTTTSSGAQKVYGPYGRTGITPFSVQGEIIGFYGRSGHLLDSVGFYYQIRVQKSQLRVGGSGGHVFDDNILSHSPTIVGIKELWIRHGNQIDSLQAKYLRADGSTFVAGKHGGNGGTETHLQFADGEKITEVRGDSNGALVDQLTFVTTTSSGAQKVYGPYGRTGKTPFSLQRQIIGFYGRSGNLLDSVGFYHT